MYTVVTHTIKEERFDHPAIAEIGMAIHSNVKPISGNVYAGNVKVANTKPLVTKRMTTDAGTVLPPEGDPVIPPGSTPDGNIRIKMNEYGWGALDAWGNLFVWGDTVSYGDVIAYGNLRGTGSLSNIETITEEKTPRSMGSKGEVCVSNKFIYICVDTDTWIRTPMQASW